MAMNKEKLQAYIMLMRLHRPVPILLILWPTLTALVLASHGFPSFKLLIIFTVGVVLMRTVGCIVNDIADRDFDKHVARTNTRPLTSGKLTVKKCNYALFSINYYSFYLCIVFKFLHGVTVIYSFVLSDTLPIL